MDKEIKLRSYYTTSIGKLYQGDCLNVLQQMEDQSVQCVVTSPPYWGLRDYGDADQLGLEPTPQEYVQKLVRIFQEVRRVLRNDGTVWLNLGDSYNSGAQFNHHSDGLGKETKRYSEGEPGKWAGHRPLTPGLKPKDLVGIPWRVAFALQDDGWYLRSEIVWHKPNPMPESVTDRPTCAHEKVFLLSKSERYFYDYEAVKEASTYSAPNSPQSIASPYGQGFSRRAANSGERKDCHSEKHERHRSGIPGGQSLELAASGKRNLRNVWNIPTRPFPGAHFAVFPPDLVEPCIKAGSKKGDTVLDPFIGAGTTGLVAQNLERRWAGIELSASSCELVKGRVPKGHRISLPIQAEEQQCP